MAIDIAKARALCAAATPGPWEADHGVYPYEGKHCGKSSRAIYYRPKPYHVVEIVESPDDLHGECIHAEADWQFIAAARTGWPEALDALENDHNSAEEVIGELRAENARLRKALEDVQKLAEYVQERRHFQQVSQIYSAVSAALASPVAPATSKETP